MWLMFFTQSGTVPVFSGDCVHAIYVLQIQVTHPVSCDRAVAPPPPVLPACVLLAPLLALCSYTS